MCVFVDLCYLRISRFASLVDEVGKRRKYFVDNPTKELSWSTEEHCRLEAMIILLDSYRDQNNLVMVTQN